MTPRTATRPSAPRTRTATARRERDADQVVGLVLMIAATLISLYDCILLIAIA
jgi:hypothetical protein